MQANVLSTIIVKELNSWNNNGASMERKFYLLVVLFVSFGINTFAQSTDGEKTGPAFYLETNLANKYSWRGIIYDQGLVVQPTLGVDYDNWTFQLWGNITAIEEDGFAKNHELDFLLQYTFEVGKLVLTPSLQLYTYPDQEGDSALELFLSCDYPIGEFTFNTTLSRDIKLGIPYLFGTHSLAYSKELNEDFTLDASAGLGWGTEKFNLYYVGIEKSALNYLFACAALSYTVNDKICLKPFVEGYLLTDSEIKGLTNDSHFNFGLSVYIGF